MKEVSRISRLYQSTPQLVMDPVVNDKRDLQGHDLAIFAQLNPAIALLYIGISFHEGIEILVLSSGFRVIDILAKRQN